MRAAQRHPGLASVCSWGSVGGPRPFKHLPALSRTAPAALQALPGEGSLLGAAVPLLAQPGGSGDGPTVHREGRQAWWACMLWLPRAAAGGGCSAQCLFWHDFRWGLYTHCLDAWLTGSLQLCTILRGQPAVPACTWSPWLGCRSPWQPGPWHACCGGQGRASGFTALLPPCYALSAGAADAHLRGVLHGSGGVPGAAAPAVSWLHVRPAVRPSAAAGREVQRRGGHPAPRAAQGADEDGHSLLPYPSCSHRPPGPCN